MALLQISSFAGIDRLAVPARRGNGTGRAVRNASLNGGGLAPITTLSIPGERQFVGVIRDNARFLNRWWDGTQFYWVSFRDDGGRPVHFVSGIFPEDTHNRAYWTGEGVGGEPRMSAQENAIGNGGGVQVPLASFLLGIPNVPTPLSLNSQIMPLDEDAESFDVAWVHTLVSQFGEEGPPSQVSVSVEINDGQAVELTLPAIPNSITRDRAFGNDSKRRVYRANTGSQATEFQFVKEVDLNVSMVIDDVPAHQLGEVLPSLTWTPPPEDLLGLIYVPGGILAGFAGDTIWFSEPYLPHAWPEEYRVALDAPILSLGLVANGVIALTRGRPYLITGAQPGNFAPAQAAFPQGCINERSVVNMGGRLFYAAPDGLATIDGASGALLTDGLLSPREWRTRYDVEHYLGFNWEGSYVGLLDGDRLPADGKVGFIFDPERGLSDLEWSAKGGFSNPSDGSLRLLGIDR